MSTPAASYTLNQVAVYYETTVADVVRKMGQITPFFKPHHFHNTHTLESPVFSERGLMAFCKILDTDKAFETYVLTVLNHRKNLASTV